MVDYDRAGFVRRPEYDEEFARHVTDDFGLEERWRENWAEGGEPPTYEEALAHVIRLRNVQLYALSAQLKQSPGYTEGDEESPFFSESYLYPLMGKEDARTVLAMLKTTFRMLEALLGKPFPMRAIY